MSDLQALKLRAMEYLKTHSAQLDTETWGRDPDKIRQLVQELHTHQIELEMQNDELRETQIKLTETNLRYSDLYDFAPIGYLTLNSAGIVTQANLRIAEMLELPRNQIVGKRFDSFFHPDVQDEYFLLLSSTLKTHARQSRELRLIDRNDGGDLKEFWGLIEMRPIISDEGEMDHINLSVSDVSDKHQGQVLLEHQAFYDTLTDLPNRQLFINRLGQYLAHLKRNSNHAALLYIDIDNFKLINDSYGHSVGDKVLKQVATALSSDIRAEDTAARFGGDEFVVLLVDLNADAEKAAAEAQTIAEEIKSSLIKSLYVDGHRIQTELSVGIALFPNGAGSVDEIISHADIAMYRAKHSGKNISQFYNQKIHDRLKHRLIVSQELRLAIENKEFEIYYQPQLNKDHGILGAECLLRWNHPKNGIVPPDEFIPILEDSSLIIEVGTWVLEQACQQIASWHTQGGAFSNLDLSVNVSPKQFNDDNFVCNIEDTLKKTGAKPENLILEITENMLINNIEKTIVKMDRLKRLGIRFSIDDFGTGYSSLSYIKRLPVDSLKIDKSFVRTIHQDIANSLLVDTIMSIAKNFNFSVVAEGVETEDEFLLLKEKGCLYFQGYLFSHPLPFYQFEQFIKEHS